ncbi:cardiolipin synthase [Cognatishimia sp. F0-27]|uniref:cardiolipin synthase n=1 Tax=Cognatishimia sp. F0-27 TaxID=2816855 RepID=UPI001D0C8AB2
MTLSFWATAYLALVVVAVFCAWRAVREARTPQGSVGWVVFLLSVPVFAVPAYLIFGQYRLKGVVVARRDTAKIIAAIGKYSARRRPEALSKAEYGPFEAAAQLPVLRGNAASLLIDGRAAFDAMFSAIDEAERYVLVQFYILRHDGLGRALRDRLIAARKRGVEVYVSYDHLGSLALKNTFRQSLLDAGIRLAEPRRSQGVAFRFSLNYRNHRKTVIVDGKRGFTGGLNVGDEYLGLDPDMGDWRDTHVSLRGPVVAQLQLVFAEDWHFSTGDLIVDDLDWRPGMQAENMVGLIVATGPVDDFDSGSMFYFASISRAKTRVWLASPYFVPDLDTLSALKHAALRGVEVRILIPDLADNRIPWLAAYAYCDELRDAGVQIWRFEAGFMHQKVVLVDDDYAAVGTTNLDNRSFRLNFEAMAVFFDTAFATQVEAMLIRDFDRSSLSRKSLGDQPLGIRVGAPIARLFAPIL